MPARCRLSRTALRGLTGPITSGMTLGVRPPSPLRCAELAIYTALRVNGTLLNWTNTILSDIENRRAGSLDAPGTGDNDDMTVGEVSPQRSAEENGAGGVPNPELADVADDLPPDRYIEREGSWLRFNQRVLELAQDETIPLLERVRFMAIFASNLDEFFMVRVAGRMRRMATGLPVEGVTTGMPPDQVLEQTLETARELSLEHAEFFNNAIRPALAQEGIEILRWKELSASEQENLHQLFRDRIYPVLTPLVVDPAHPFPYISGLSLSLAVMIAEPDTGLTMFARVKVPPLLPRFLTVSKYRFVPLEDVIAAHLTELFTGLEILEHHVFRVTRPGSWRWTRTSPRT